MLKLNKLFAILMVASLFMLVSCGGDTPTDNTKETKEVAKEATGGESQMVLDHFNANGDLLNAAVADGGFPRMITATELNDELGGYVLVIDIRNGKSFASGHIDGAMNIKLANLLYFFKEDMNPADYDKVVLVCYSGQSGSYAAGVLNLMGYTNVYALKYGMSSWNPKFANKWQNGIGDEFADQLETTENAMAAKTTLAELNTGKATVEEIIAARAQELFDNGFTPVRVKAPEVFANKDNYYIVNYLPEEAKALGHIPGTVYYGPKTMNVNLETLPTDKPILVYCYTGQNSAFTMAYLRMLGYDANTVLYGANSFMHNILKENSLKAFDNSMTNDFEIIETEFGGVEEEGAGGC